MPWYSFYLSTPQDFELVLINFFNNFFQLLVESTSYIASPDKLCLSMDWSLEDENRSDI